MKTYEFVTPSDAITFKACDHKVAFMAALYVGNGKAFCKCEDGTELPTCILFASEEETNEHIEKNLGCSFVDFFDARRDDILESLESFAYTNIRERFTYDTAIEAIEDEDKLKEFKDKHEDRNRSSISKYVQFAWDVARRNKDKDFSENGEEEECQEES